MSTSLKPTTVAKALYPNVSWTSLLATLTADAGAVVTSVVPGLHVPTNENAIIIAVAGVLTALHIHVPRLLAKLGGSSSSTESLPKELESLVAGLFNHVSEPPSAPKP